VGVLCVRAQEGEFVTVQSTRVLGLDVLRAKSSAVDSGGQPSQQLIDGLGFRPVRPVPHEDGTLAEIVRADWPEVDDEVVQVHLTTTYPGRVRAWGLHQRSTDRLFVVKGLISIVVFDGREDSPTYGTLNEFKVSERNPALLVIPPNLYHGWKTIGVDEAFVLNMPTSMYNYDEPDAFDLPYDCAEALEIVPFRW
jgi:dTDP-4-dehydrorhamnose 3,5-epimerase